MVHKPVPLTRGKLVTISLSILFVFCFSIAFSVYSANAAVSAQQEAEKKQAAAAMTPVCKWLYATDDIYYAEPPSTETGKRVAKSVRELISTFQCERFVPRGN